MSQTADISVLGDAGLGRAQQGGAPTLGLSRAAWGQIVVLAALMVALFRFNLIRLWGKTNPIDGQDSNWQHSIFVPLIGLWYLFIHREELLAGALQPVRRERGIRTLAVMGLTGLALVGAYLMNAGIGWLAGLAGLGFLAVLPRAVLRLVGMDFGETPERVRWGARAGLTVSLLALATLGPRLDVPASQWGILQATNLLVVVLAAATWLPMVVPTSTALGAAAIFGGLLTFGAAIYPIQNDYAKDVGMIVTVFGVVALLGGWGVVKVAWFPIAFLVVALPWPELVYQKLAWPLQKLAASAAVGTLRLFGVDAERGETTIWFRVPENGQWRLEPLEVAEACAGLRSLMTFLMVAGTVAFLQRRAIWEKLAITFSAVPIAIFCNMMRVSGQGLLHRYVSKEISVGFAHSFVGLLMLIPGFFLILLVQWALDKLFIDEVDGGKAAAAAAAASKRRVVAVPRKARSQEPGARSQEPGARSQETGSAES